VLERANYPRYKTCGGGLVGASLAAVDGWLSVPSRDRIHAATVTYRGGWAFTHRAPEVMVEMVVREEFDDALRKAATEAGAVVRQGSTVRTIAQSPDVAVARLAGGEEVRARVIVGADGSSGVTSRHVGVRFGQVDLGLEVELAVPPAVRDRWRHRLLLDWGPIPGSYGWVFPKSDRLTVGVIAARGHGEATRAYLRDLLDRLDLGSFEAVQDSGHLTRCRTADSPLRAGRVLVAGDAAGLLEPWTREGISFALRSGALAGAAAATAAAAADPERLDGYAGTVGTELGPEMDAGRRVLAAFSRHPVAFHALLRTSRGWRAFVKLCRSELTVDRAARPLPVRAAVRVLSRV
jgi:geranylgeranyl reductase family protein